MIGGWFAASRDDVAALAGSWRSVRGGWRAARRDAAELIEHRCVTVGSQAVTSRGHETVLCTRLRLIGDTQTDVLRRWLDDAAPEEAEATVAAHFARVDAAVGGFAASVGMERLAARLGLLIGSLASVFGLARALIASAPAAWPQILLARWWLWLGFVAALLSVGARWLLGWWLRRRFRRALR